jgi:hypothetical protein
VDVEERTISVEQEGSGLHLPWNFSNGRSGPDVNLKLTPKSVHPDACRIATVSINGRESQHCGSCPLGCARTPFPVRRLPRGGEAASDGGKEEFSAPVDAFNPASSSMATFSQNAALGGRLAGQTV